MRDESRASALSLPDAPSLDWLRKQAKRRLDELRQANPEAKLADAQFDLARQYGFPSWRALKAHIDSLTVDGQLFEATRKGELAKVASLLEAHPGKLHAHKPPYEWSLLHIAAHNGQLPVVDLLLRLGLDVNTREKGDNTYAMHWAAAAAHLDIVRRLADAGGDVIGRGDDHQLEVIGWATCWDGCDDDAHRNVAHFLLSRGARHHIFSAIAMNLPEEVRRIVQSAPATLHQPMSHNEGHQLPLHFAVRMNCPEMVELLIKLGADPLGTDGSGFPPVAYATRPDIDRPVLEALRAGGGMDLFTALALGDWEAAAKLLPQHARATLPGDSNAGVLHLMTKRNNAAAVKWLLEHGADPNARWNHWDAEVTPLHLAALAGHKEMATLLLDAGADPTIRDTKHDSTAAVWAEYCGQPELARYLVERATES